jgi:hypothetical protein
MIWSMRLGMGSQSLKLVGRMRILRGVRMEVGIGDRLCLGMEALNLLGVWSSDGPEYERRLETKRTEYEAGK